MTRVVGVFPPSALTARPLLFDALARVFPVRFEGRQGGAWDGLDAAVMLGQPELLALPVPTLRYVASEPSTSSPERASVELGIDDAVDERLRGRRLSDSALTSVSERLTEGVALANDSAGVVWARDGSRRQTCLLAPSELAPTESLRDRLRAGRFVALLPLVQLLRLVCGYDSWSRPSMRAAFLFDDPNLHWRSYGHIRFSELAAHARAHRYRVSFATIPLDAWYAHPRAVRTFRSAEGRLSLTVHGNDHAFEEFARSQPTAETVPLMAQALARVDRFTRRTGLPGDRVMVPPFGLCSDTMLSAMLVVGVEALCRGPSWWAHWPGARLRTAHWQMADVTPNGGPIIGRHQFRSSILREESLLTLFLDQPLVLYGHHYDVAAGYDVLAETADWLRGVGRIEWHSLGGLARSNYVWRREPDAGLRIRCYSRHLALRVPDDVQRVLLEVPLYEAIAHDRLVSSKGEHELVVADGVARADVPATPGRQLELRLERRSEVRPIPVSGVRARAVARRAMAEARDRLHPVVRRAGLAPVLQMLETTYRRRMRARTRGVR